MIFVNKINRIYPILYIGDPYTIVEVEAVFDDDPEPTIVKFATKKLYKQLFDYSGHLWSPEELTRPIADEIYDYIPDDVLKLPADELCDWITENFD